MPAATRASRTSTRSSAGPTARVPAATGAATTTWPRRTGSSPEDRRPRAEQEDRFDAAWAERCLNEEENPALTLRHARWLWLLEKWEARSRPAMTRLSFGPRVHVLGMPGETVVEYQLHAQARVPEHVLACAAYGDASYGYFPTAKMYEEGGYEPSAGLYAPEIETRIRDCIDHLLAPIVRA